MARYLADRGARVVGIDLSGKLLAIARRYGQAAPRGVTYLRDNAQALHAVRDAAFDGVICHMALMDIPTSLRPFRPPVASLDRSMVRLLDPSPMLPPAAARGDRGR